MKNICVLGAGYVGLVSGACFADLGNNVVLLDIDERKINALRGGEIPIYEPGLSELVIRNVRAGRLDFTTRYPAALRQAEFVFVAVGTPSGVDGEAEMQYVRMAAESIAEHMDHPLIIVNKSTVPVGTGDWVADIIRKRQRDPIPFWVVSNPEFLREGSAIHDFMNPDRVVLGSMHKEAAEKVAQLHAPLRARIQITDLRTAEMIKYASNAFLATRISFINEIATICERLGADVKDVAVGMGYDRRIGPHFLDAGLGFGGSCFTGDETLFALNSPNVITQSFQDAFAEAGTPTPGISVQVVVPAEKRVLAFDLETGRPTLAEVTALTRRPYQGMMVSISASMGRTLRLTADHPVILQTPDGFVITPADSVTPGDQLMALMELPVVEEVGALNLLELLEGHALADDVYVSTDDDSFAQQYARFVHHIPIEMLRHPNEIKRHGRMALPLFHRLTTLGVLDVSAEKLKLYTAKGPATKISAIIPVDADFLRLCGYFLAEGHINRDSGRNGAVRERVSFSFHENETEYIADLQRILARYGLKFLENRSTHALSTIVSSRIFAWLLRDVLGCGTRSEDKALPRLAFNVMPDLRYELVRGAFSGDGAVTPVQDGKNLMFEYATVSKPLADGMALLLQTLGVIPSIRERWMNKSKRLAYVLRISGYSQLDAMRDVFGNKHRGKIDTILAGYQRHIRQRGFSRQGPVAALTVQGVIYEEAETHVYSLETTTGTLIAASGLVCHNCFPKDVRALEHMALVHGAHPQLLRAVLDINQHQRRQVVVKLRDILGGLDERRFGLLGLSFKPNTDDMRDAPSLDIARQLLREGGVVQAYDPVAMEVAGRMLPDIRLCESAYEAAQDVDAVVLITEWNEFRQLDMARLKAGMRGNVLLDGRNIWDPDEMAALGFRYAGVGRQVGPSAAALAGLYAGGK